MNLLSRSLPCLLLMLAASACQQSPKPTNDLAEALGIEEGSQIDLGNGRRLVVEKIEQYDTPQEIQRTAGVIRSIEPSGIKRRNPTQMVTFVADQTGKEEKVEIFHMPDKERKSMIGKKVYRLNLVEMRNSQPGAKGTIIPVFGAA